MDPESIAKLGQTFVTTYYQQFDTNKALVQSLYVSYLPS